jgi:hypothetical protein
MTKAIKQTRRFGYMKEKLSALFEKRNTFIAKVCDE